MFLARKAKFCYLCSLQRVKNSSYFCTCEKSSIFYGGLTRFNFQEWFHNLSCSPRVTQEIYFFWVKNEGCLLSLNLCIRQDLGQTKLLGCCQNCKRRNFRMVSVYVFRRNTKAGFRVWFFDENLRQVYYKNFLIFRELESNLQILKFLRGSPGTRRRKVASWKGRFKYLF